jgi:hypothetical protein
MSMFKDLAGMDKKTGKMKKQDKEEFKIGADGIAIADKTENINLYRDPRDEDEELMLLVTTDKICSDFLDAVENSLYGYRWECPNGGDSCKYRHCLPKGYVLQLKKPKEKKEGEEQSIEEWIE